MISLQPLLYLLNIIEVEKAFSPSYRGYCLKGECRHCAVSCSKKLSENFQKLSEKREKLSEIAQKYKNFTKNFQKLYADGEIFFHRFFFAQLCNAGREQNPPQVLFDLLIQPNKTDRQFCVVLSHAFSLLY